MLAPRRRKAIGRVLVAVVVIVLVGLSGLGYVLYEQTAIKPTQVTLGLDFTPNPGDAPLFYGLDQGIFKSNGINLTIIPGTNMDSTISSLAAGDVDFALAAPQTIVDLVANDKYTNIEAVADEYAGNTLVILYNNASISKISDLDGKTGSMTSPTSGDIVGDFRLFAQTNKLNFSSMNIEYNTVSTSDQLLLAGKVQFIVVSIYNLGAVVPAAQAAGMKLGYFAMADDGLPSEGIIVATTKTLVQQNPTLVAKFVKATMESLVQAYNNQTGAVQDLVKSNPQLNYTASLVTYQEVLGCCSINPSNLTSDLQYGWMSPVLMQQTVNTEITADNLSISLNATTIYTNEFVQQP